MRRLAAEIEEIHQSNRRTAEYGCAVMDEVRRGGLTPAILRDAQDSLRRDLLGTEDHLREARRDAVGEKHRLSTSAKSDSMSREAALEHVQLLDARERALVMRRRMLRQIADGFAWLVLDQDPRLILPLFEEQTHQLPPHEGVGGPAEIARKAHDSGHFFVIENDLTRCLGTGDLTVVFADRPWRHPLAFEVKSSARPAWRAGGQLELLAIAAQSGDPVDAELHDQFSLAVGMGPVPLGTRLRERPEQTERLLSHMKLLLAAVDGTGPRLPGPSEGTWKTLDNVLSRALAEAVCYDLAERGVAYFAIRSVDDRAPTQVSADLLEKLGDLGFGRDCKLATSVDLRENDVWSALALPIVLWPVSSALRAALLCGELFLGCVVRPETWREVMQAEGLELEELGNDWSVTAPDGSSAYLDVIEVWKLCLGVAFGGVSPQEIAARLAASLRDQRPGVAPVKEAE